jgi:PDZ domain-containing protein
VAGLAEACVHHEAPRPVAAQPVWTPPEPPPAPPEPSRSVVLVQVDGVDVDWNAPWGSGKPWTRTLTGLAVDGGRILVSGWGLRNHRQVEVQKPGSIARVTAKVALFDADAGLAELTVDDPAFWQGVSPAVLSGALPGLRTVKVLHAVAEGIRVEASDGAVTRFELSGRCEFVHMKISQLDMQRVGISDVVVADGTVAGLVTNASNGEAYAVGSRTLIDFANEAAHPPYRGCATADFIGQKLSNPVLRGSLGLGPGDGGWLVSEVWPLGSSSGALERGDVLLSVGDTKVDSDGTYVDPAAGRLSCPALFSQGHHPGDVIPVQVLRHGERRAVNVQLKRWPGDQTLVPWYAPESNGYAVRGGLVFQRLSHEYLLTFGKDWESKAPPRVLEPFELERWASSAERQGIIVLTAVLPVAATLGYEHISNLIVDRINGVPVWSLDEVRGAFAHPGGGYHVVTFAPGQSVQRIVLDVQEAKAADASIRAKYHVEEEGVGPAISQ